MDDYTDASGAQIKTTATIQVEVLPCVPSIDTSASSIEDVSYHRWRDSEPSLRSFAPFSYDAGCQLEFSYSAKIRLQDGNEADLPYPEMTFYPEARQMTIKKCDPMDSATEDDQECVDQVVPYFKSYTVEITGTLNDADMTSASVAFDVTIGPDCDGDTLTYMADVNDQFGGTYFLGATEAREMALSPSLRNEVPNCPITCELTSTDSFDPIFNFDEQTGDVTIKTMLASLNGQSHSYAIECLSELSLAQTMPAVQTFDVRFAFEDCNPQILLNGASMPDYEQYWFIAGGQSQAVQEYFLVSDCALEFTYSATARELRPDDPDFVPGDLVPLAYLTRRVIKFDPATRVFTFAMCDPNDPASTGPECAGDAFFMHYEIAVVATLNDGAATSDDSLRFRVTFGPDCTNDALMFTGSLGA